MLILLFTVYCLIIGMYKIKGNLNTSKQFNIHEHRNAQLCASFMQVHTPVEDTPYLLQHTNCHVKLQDKQPHTMNIVFPLC